MSESQDLIAVYSKNDWLLKIIIIIWDSLPKEAILPLLAITGIGFVRSIFLLNYKVTHSKQNKIKF